MRLLCNIILLASISAIHGDGVRSNGGNCVGVKSCRPRCVTFRLDREDLNCGGSEGIFLIEGDVNPWDVKRFTTTNCDPSLDLSGDLTVRVGEEGHSGSYFYSNVDLLASDSDRFTFCSVYPCTKEECSLPEQMGFGLQFSFFNESLAVDDFTAEPLLVLGLFLKAAFVGSPLQDGETNRFGPLHVEWMDDPAGCRVDQFSDQTPEAPLTDPDIYTKSSVFDSSLYCEGDEYLPADLPMVAPTAGPTQTPSAAPSLSLAPSTSPTHTEIGEEQLEGLRRFYNATNMGLAPSSDLHNWFTTPDYCSFTGVACDERGYVIVIDLTGRRLTGTLPSNLNSLSRLRQLKVINNRIEGSIPEDITELDQLTQLELGSNKLTGILPVGLHKLQHLRRLMVQFNNLEGTIPHEFCQISRLSAFDISGNYQMFGVIPQCLGNLPLEVLRVDDVGLVGQVPPQLCNATKLNGLSPNPYGCDAIACPAGQFEPSVGRTYNNHTACVDCPFDSNVIGSTACLLVINNNVVSSTVSPSSVESTSPTASPSPSATVTVSTAPTTMPSTTPDGNTTAFPSVSPSISPNSPNHSSGSSMQPSSAPSNLPSFEPSMLPTSRTTLSPSFAIEAVTVTVVFADVQQQLDGVGKDELEEATELYLESNDVLVTNITVLSQLVGDATSFTRVHDTRRRLADALVVEMEIQGRSDKASLAEVVNDSLVNNYTEYFGSLKMALPVLIPPTASPTVVEEVPDAIPNSKTGTPWWLLGLMFGMAVIALIAAFLAYNSNQKRRAETSSRRLESLASFPTQPGMVAQEVLSVESSSGWNSETSPGSPGSPGEFVNDHEVQEWTSAQKKNTEDMYMNQETENVV